MSYTDAKKVIHALNLLSNAIEDQIVLDNEFPKHLVTYKDARKILSEKKYKMPLIDTGIVSVIAPNDESIIELFEDDDGTRADSEIVSLPIGGLLKVNAKLLNDIKGIIVAQIHNVEDEDVLEEIKQILSSLSKTDKKKKTTGDDKEKAKAQKEKEKEKAQKEKEKAKALKEKEKEKEKAQKEKEKAKALKEKEKAKALKEKEKAKALKEKEKAKALKEKEKAKAQKEKEKEKAKMGGYYYDSYDNYNRYV